MDDRLSLSVTHADGRVSRWGPDEPNGGDVPGDLTFSTSMPGGFRDLSCSLLRRIDLDYPDQGLFDNVRAYGPGNRTAWDGRFTQFPRSHGQGFSVTPGAVGWAAHLRDDPTFVEVYVDRDVSAMQGIPLTRRAATSAAIPVDQDYTWTTSGGALIFNGVDSKAITDNSLTEAWRVMPAGRAVAKIMYRGTHNNTANVAAPLLSTDNDDAMPSAATVALTLDDTLRTATVTAPERYAMFQARATATHTPAGPFSRMFSQLAFYGDHGLTTRTASDGGPDGVYASDVIIDVIERAAPLLSAAGVEATDFVVPQLTFPTAVMAEDAISLVNAYHLWEWGVYDDREFFYRPTDPDRLTWEARLDQGAFLDLEGDTAEQIFNGVYVSYPDSGGYPRTIGPPGAAADHTSTLLEDTSETNPVNAHGIPRRWAKLDISQTTTQTGAEQLGYVWLREHSLPQRRGNLTLVGSVTHPTEGDVPVWRVRAGDYIRPTDMPGYVPRRIISTSYTHATRSLSCELDNTSLKLDAIIERALGVAMVGVL